ncbi:hypothetical protein BsWGS_00241 [Bradybaena similaris]
MSEEAVDVPEEPETPAPEEGLVGEHEDEDAGSTVPSAMSLQNVDEGVEDPTAAMSASMKAIYQDMEPTLKSRSNLRIAIDAEDVILKNAIRNIKANFEETKVLSEIRKMYDMYMQSQASNQILVTKIDRYLDKIDKYEARHRRDPRVMAALRMAESHRNALKALDEEKKDIEAEKIEARLEVKHLEDMMKNKNRELAKIQDEVKKLRDIEKNAELCETQLIRKENELRQLHEKFDAEIIHARIAAKEDIMKEIALKREQQERDVKETAPDLKRFEYDQAEKRALQKDNDEKTKLIHALEVDKKAKKLQVKSCRDRCRMQAVAIRLMMRKSAQLRKEKLAAENENVKWKQYYDTLKSEFEKAQEQLTELRGNNTLLKARTKKEIQENQILSSSLREAQKKVADTTQNLAACHHSSKILQKDIEIKDSDLSKVNNNLHLKTVAHDNLSKKCNSLQNQKLEQMDLLRMSQGQTAALAKDLTGMRKESVKQYKNYQELLQDRARLRANLFLIKSHYYESEDKCQVLRNEKEMQKLYADQLEQQAAEMHRKLQSVVQTNIQLYCENTTQEEIAVLQNNQYKIKEKEIQGLEFSSAEQNEVIARLEHMCRDKTHVIEQLSAEVVTLSALVKNYKTQIQTLTNEERTLRFHLAQMMEKEKAYLTSLELLRRQRDLFGTQLLKSVAELGLEKQRSRVSNTVMTSAAVAHRNLLNDLSLLKLEIRDLRRKLKTQEGNSLMIHSLRQELSKFATTLELEKAKARVLEQTREPIVHRWRDLMASDPSKYEMFMKMFKVTKRMIAKTTESTEKELIIQQKDYYMLEIQAMVARRFGPQNNPEVSQAKAIIRKQARQLQALQGELNIAHHDLEMQNNVIENHQESLLEAKKKAVQQQRKNRRLTNPGIKKLSLPPIFPKVVRTYDVKGS